ncbi:MAG: hypothetical protein LC772_09190 [Chloroflexi bacterium]|nr:hypothetical protein [Chloroflexota bacterium]
MTIVCFITLSIRLQHRAQLMAVHRSMDGHLPRDGSPELASSGSRRMA